MKKMLYILLLAALLAACGPAATQPVVTEPPLPTATSTPAPSATPTLEPTPSYPSEGYGPANFPSNVNPLTGLEVADPSLLERHPMLVKISNLPRTVRPQWGLSLADIVFEYYTEEGSTRFAAIFYGNDAEMVGPIRSARFVDTHLVRGYKAVFAYGGAYEKVTERLFYSGFTDRLIIEGASTPLFRYDPNGFNHLMVNTAELSAFATEKGIENGRQPLDGMFFQLEAPAGGQTGEQFIVRYSGSIYNRWEYDPATGKYLRYVDAIDDFNIDNEQYELLTDRLTDQPIAFDNVAILFVVTDHYNVDPEVVDIQFVGSGVAYAYRDGQVYQELTWQRNANDVVTLLNADGTPFAFKPGTTWFEVIGMNSTVTETEQGLRFRHLMP